MGSGTIQGVVDPSTAIRSRRMEAQLLGHKRRRRNSTMRVHHGAREPWGGQGSEVRSPSLQITTEPEPSYGHLDRRREQTRVASPSSGGVASRLLLAVWPMMLGKPGPQPHAAEWRHGLMAVRAQHRLLGHAAVERSQNAPGRGEVFARVHHGGIVEQKRVARLPFERDLRSAHEVSDFRQRGELIGAQVRVVPKDDGLDRPLHAVLPEPARRVVESGLGCCEEHLSS
mmetsp:Transcript_7507/g.24658  ORF Transcript_7507/g.24658 Transcript_7507/m.24658 type:complete len:228 (+) Transcript_7507:213-896(+)